MSCHDHVIYNKAVLAFKNQNLELFQKILSSLELTWTEEALLKSREMIGSGYFKQARKLLLKIHISSSHFLNGERALLLGHCYAQLHDVMKSRYSYSAALKEYVVCKDRKGQFLCHLLLGRSLLEGGLIPLSLNHLNEAKSLALGEHEETLVSRHLANLYIKSGNERKAMMFVELVLQKSKDLNDHERDAFKEFARSFYKKTTQNSAVGRDFSVRTSKDLDH